MVGMWERSNLDASWLYGRSTSATGLYIGVWKINFPPNTVIEWGGGHQQQETPS